MIDPQAVTEELLSERYVSVSDNISAVLDDADLPKSVQKICADHHVVDEDRVLIIQQLIALVLLGLVHEHDLGKEINAALGLNNPQAANDIANSISLKIFAPIKDDLAKSYRPLVGVAPMAQPITTTPSSVVQPTSPHTPTQVVSPFKPSATPAAPQPFLRTPPTASSTPITSSGAPQTDRPAPFMIHQETEFKPAAQKTDFRVSVDAEKSVATGAASMFSAQKPQMPPAITARVEIGNDEPVKKPTMGRTDISAPRVVHYSEASSPVSSMAGISVMPQQPKPPSVPAFQTPATPAHPPTAPMAPIPQPQAPLASVSGSAAQRPTVNLGQFAVPSGRVAPPPSVPVAPQAHLEPPPQAPLHVPQPSPLAPSVPTLIQPPSSQPTPTPPRAFVSPVITAPPTQQPQQQVSRPVAPTMDIAAPKPPQVSPVGVPNPNGTPPSVAPQTSSAGPKLQLPE